MGSEKRKRKSAGAFPGQPAKERRLDYPKWRDHSGYTVLQLVEKQSVLFVGEATLQVLNGSVCVSGKHVGVESPPLVLSTGGRFNLAITITADAEATQVPFAASPLVEVSLQSRPTLPPAPLSEGPAQVRDVSVRGSRQGPGAGGAAGVGGRQQQGQGQQGAAGGSGGGTAGEGGPSRGGGAPCTSFTLYRSTDPGAPPAVVLNREWEQALNDLCHTAASGAPLVLAVLGAKGMGKSTLTRLAANRLMDAAPGGVVAYLDTDVGQPEATPPGLASLHLLGEALGGPLLGPPHAHARRPWASRFVGDVSPQHDPQLYLSAVQALYGDYWRWAQGVVGRGGAWPPLVVNTHGWVKGLGFDLLTQLLRIVAPTHVVQIRGGSEKKNLPRGVFWQEPLRGPQPAGGAAIAAPTALIVLDTLAAPDTTTSPAPPQQQQVNPDGGGDGGGGASCSAAGPPTRSLKPVESRSFAWHAWAKRVVGLQPAWGSYESDDFWRNAGQLAALAPWKVPLSALHVQLLSGSLSPHQVGRLLNGAVVGLLATQPPPQKTLHNPPFASTAATGAGTSTIAGGRGAAPAAAIAAADEAAADAWWALDSSMAAAAAATYPPGRVSYIGATVVPPPLLPCVGLGIMRAVDMEAGEVYVLTDVEEEVLESVGVIAVGRLELPGPLVAGGEVVSPYMQLFGLSAEATGAGAAKARRNLSRSSLVELAG